LKQINEKQNKKIKIKMAPISLITAIFATIIAITNTYVLIVRPKVKNWKKQQERERLTQLLEDAKRSTNVLGREVNINNIHGYVQQIQFTSKGMNISLLTEKGIVNLFKTYEESIPRMIKSWADQNTPQ
jgi:uncharacterized membrane protein YbjE (DUF340 family)